MMSCRPASLAAALLLGAATIGLSACNTISGAGKDVSAAGHDVSRGATSADNSIVNSTGASKN